MLPGVFLPVDNNFVVVVFCTSSDLGIYFWVSRKELRVRGFGTLPAECFSSSSPVFIKENGKSSNQLLGGFFQAVPVCALGKNSMFSWVCSAAFLHLFLLSP